MDVLSIGETMIAFSPTEVGPMRYHNDFTSHIAGAETNTLIGLAKLGVSTGWISQLGDDEFGHRILSFVRGEGVDVSRVSLTKDYPTGIFFKEKVREDQTRVNYYRSHSAASAMTDDLIDEDYIKQFKYLYITGITPALSDSCRQLILNLIKVARSHQLTVVFDPNLRLKLWSEDTARQVLTDIIAQSDIVLPGIAEGEFLFNETDEHQIAQRILELGAKLVVVKLGAKGAYYQSNEENGYAKAAFEVNVVDPVGAGDGFAAGFLAGYLEDLPLQQAVEQACNVGALVTTVKGDIEGLPSKEELTNIKHQTDDVIR